MINIQDIIPFMKKGWVAMDANGCWGWWEHKPKIKEDYYWFAQTGYDVYLSDAIDIAPADEWRKRNIILQGDINMTRNFDLQIALMNRYKLKKSELLMIISELENRFRFNKISVDMSTGEVDAGNRIFAKFIEKQGDTLLCKFDSANYDYKDFTTGISEKMYLDQLLVKENMIKSYQEENAKLKELLKECRRYIDYWGYEDTHGRAILPQIDEVLK